MGQKAQAVFLTVDQLKASIKLSYSEMPDQLPDVVYESETVIVFADKSFATLVNVYDGVTHL